MSKYYKSETIKISSTKKDIKLLILKPKKNIKSPNQTPVLLWIHGGGYAVGSRHMIYMSLAIKLVKKYGVVVVSPEYCLSKEAPYPRALEDCYATLKYIKDNALNLGINSSQIMVGGESAGGGLSVALSMYAKDKKEVNIAYLMPIYPMIDNLDTESSKDNHEITWNTKRNHKAWKMYLGDLYYLKDKVPYYAAPARQTDYTNLPPTYTFVGDRDPFYCETLKYVENLNKANVEAKCDIYPNCFHAFDMLLPFKKISKKAIKTFEENFLEAQKKYFAKQND